MSELTKSVFNAVFMAVVSLIIFMLLENYVLDKPFARSENGLSMNPSALKSLEVVFVLSVVLGSFADGLVKKVISRVV